MRAKEEKKHFNEQANMWQKERDLYAEEEKRLKAKIDQINKDNQQFLKLQEEQKALGQSKKMGKTEKLLNKGLMKEIKQKQREMKQTSQ